MASKQNLWFLVLFSLVLVLSVYYVTMPDELFLTNNNYEETKEVIDVKESEILTAMQVELDETRDEIVASIKEELNNNEASIEEKNNAYEELLYLNEIKGVEETIETKIKSEFSLNSFAKVENNQVVIVVVKENHDATLANDIMRSVQSMFKEDMYITVKFEK